MNNLIFQLISYLIYLSVKFGTGAELFDFDHKKVGTYDGAKFYNEPEGAPGNSKSIIQSKTNMREFYIKGHWRGPKTHCEWYFCLKLFMFIIYVILYNEGEIRKIFSEIGRHIFFRFMENITVLLWNPSENTENV